MSVAATSLPHPVGMARARSGPSRLFVHGALFSTLFLQKFGITLGGHSFLLLALPVCAALWAWMIFSGRARINDRALILYALLLCGVLLDAVIVSLSPGKLDNFSIPSLALLTVLYSLFVFEPSEKFDTSIVVDIYLKYTLAFAFLGIFQYAAQFAGLRISSLSTLFPALKPLLVEGFFNSNAVMEYGSNVIRSNAIFLGEPSALSQLLVFAIAIEVFAKKRFRFLPVYIVAYLTTFSGTGLLSLIVALVGSAFFSVKDALRLPVIALGGAMLAGLIALLVPSVADSFTKRLGEFDASAVNSSAYSRYIAQGRAWSDMIDDGSLWTGNGPGSFDRSYGTQGVASNPVLKLSHDYGVLPMAMCFVLIVTTIWLPHQRIISLLFLATFQLAGGSELNPSFLVPMLILCVWGFKYPFKRPRLPPVHAFAVSREMAM